MIKAVIFDMDGTVVDSTECDFHAWQKVFGESGINLSFETYKSFLGKRGVEAVKEYINKDASP